MIENTCVHVSGFHDLVTANGEPIPARTVIIDDFHGRGGASVARTQNEAI